MAQRALAQKKKAEEDAARKADEAKRLAEVKENDWLAEAVERLKAEKAAAAAAEAEAKAQAEAAATAGGATNSAKVASTQAPAPQPPPSIVANMHKMNAASRATKKNAEVKHVAELIPSGVVQADADDSVAPTTGALQPWILYFAL